MPAKKTIKSAQEQLHASVQSFIGEVNEKLAHELPEAEYREYLGEAYKFYRSPIFHDILRRVSDPMAEFIIANAQNFEEVVAHRAVLLAVQDIKVLVETMARQYEAILSEAGQKPSDIIPNV